MDPLMKLSELEDLLARIGFQRDSVIRGLVNDVREGIWQETARTQPFKPRAH